jgi:hypothetical protein
VAEPSSSTKAEAPHVWILSRSTYGDLGGEIRLVDHCFPIKRSDGPEDGVVSVSPNCTKERYDDSGKAPSSNIFTFMFERRAWAKPRKGWWQAKHLHLSRDENQADAPNRPGFLIFPSRFWGTSSQGYDVWNVLAPMLCSIIHRILNTAPAQWPVLFEPAHLDFEVNRKMAPLFT